MLLKGKVVNLLPTMQPNRALIRVNGWDETFVFPVGDFKIGQRVAIEVSPILVSGAVAAGNPRLQS